MITLAQTDLGDVDPIHLENFKIELSGFFKGSAIPQFIFTPRVQTTIANVDKQRKIVNQRFEKLMDISNTGEYAKIKDLYSDALRKNIYTRYNQLQDDQLSDEIRIRKSLLNHIVKSVE